MPSKQRLPDRLYNSANRLLERLGRRAARFVESEDALIEAACKAANSADLGDPGELEGFRVLLRAYDQESKLNPFGRMMVTQELTRLLKNRLTAQQSWTASPEIREIEVRRPIFVLGLPRSGTTALHALLACDPANQVLEYWLAATPAPRPPREEWARDPRFKEAVQGLRVMYFLDPSLKAIHLMSADGPEECRQLLQESFTDDTFECNATIPSYSEWYAQRDMRPSYARHRDLLRLIGSTDADRRWVLKYPAHMRHLRTVMETYPDACFVQTHRDPARVLPSLCSLITGWRGIYEDGPDPRAIGQWQLDQWSQTMRENLEIRGATDSTRFFDLHFRELVSDPIASIRRMYTHFGSELSAEAEQSMRRWHEDNPQGKHGEHRYEPEVFGLTRQVMAERFELYAKHFQVPEEPTA